MAAAFAGEPLGLGINMGGGLNEMAAAAVEFDLGDLLGRGAVRHHGDKRQTDQPGEIGLRSEEHTSELQSLMRISYAVFCLKKKKSNKRQYTYQTFDIFTK